MKRQRLPLARRYQRRGATLVFVAVMLVALLGVCSLAIDLSRLYVGVNELQTAVDAAALRGALSLQSAPNTDPGGAVKTFVESSNTVLGAAVTYQPVTYLKWNPSTGNGVSVDPFSPNSGINAVRVTANLSAGLLFGRAFSSVVQRTNRTATAVVANVGLTCVRPWVFSLTDVFARVGLSVPAGSRPTVAQIATLRNAGLNARLYLMFAPPNGNPPSTTTTSPWAGKWVGVNLDGTGSFTSAMNTCNATLIDFEREPPVAFANATANESGNEADKNEKVVTTTLSNVQYRNKPKPGICDEFEGLNDRCSGAGETADKPGVAIPIILGSSVSGTFADAGVAHRAQLMTTLRLVCVKNPNHSTPAKGNKPAVVNRTQCDQAPSNPDWGDVAVGTMYGYLDFALPTFSGKYALGSGGSTAQRLILVK
ncbi:MAG: pilus assembly protein [Gemmatimonadota bacterium]|nr:pilus assembly protein [Gemmatimonadota bacterium]MDQ8167898.1 pilus assembly protein [Gemmatimonadota bacterium]